MFFYFTGWSGLVRLEFGSLSRLIDSLLEWQSFLTKKAFFNCANPEFASNPDYGIFLKQTSVNFLPALITVLKENTESKLPHVNIVFQNHSNLYNINTL